MLGILCNGFEFQFFKLEGQRGKERTPRFSLGEFDDGNRRIVVSSPSTWDASFDTKNAVLQTRSACEALFYMFLQAYNCGLEADWNRSVERSKAEEGKERDGSTPRWRNSIIMASKAMEEAKSVWIQHREGKVDESQSMAKKALKLLAERCVITNMTCYSLFLWLLEYTTNKFELFSFLSAVSKKPLPQPRSFPWVD